MKKIRKFDVLDSFIKGYKLLIFCMNASTSKNHTSKERESFLKMQISTTVLIRDLENIIKKIGLYDETFLCLKKELNDCVKKYNQLSPKNIKDLSYIETSFNILKTEYVDYLKELKLT